jgi:ligand-binding sensor domain-containing protein/two-component sensor histidine kinase
MLMLLVAGMLCHGERLPIRIYTSVDGLPNDSVHCIRRDSQGYLWFGTAEGLGRFDGSRFVTYGVETGLPDRAIGDFRETRDGVYWAATAVGVVEFHPLAGKGAATVHRLADWPASNRVNCLYEDSAGNLWAGTESGLFVRPPHGEFRPEIPGLWVLALLQDQRQSLWVATDTGLYRLPHGGKPERYTARSGVDSLVSDLLQDRSGRIWISTHAGLMLLVADPEPDRPVIARRFGHADGLPDAGTGPLFEASDGRVWVSTSAGLAAFDGARFRVYGTAEGLPLAMTGGPVIADDADGNLWANVPAGGVMKLARSGFTSFQANDGLSVDTVYSIFGERSGRPCALTGSLHVLLLNCFDGHRFTPVHPNTPKNIASFGWGVNQLSFQDHLGEWWIATGQGLCRFPKADRVEMLAHLRPKATYTKDGGMPGNEVFRLYEDSRGDVWVSTIDGGMARWDRKSGRFCHYPDQLDGGPRKLTATAYREDRVGNVWIAFYSGGVARYRDGRFTFFEAADGAPVRLVLDIYLDHAGRLWMGGNSGLTRVDNPAADHPRFVQYTSADGLASNNAVSVTEDLQGRIYVGSRRGLDRFNPDEPLRPGNVAHFTVADGLASNFVQMAFRDGEGALWFGSQHGGLSRLIPQADRPHTPPPVHIDALRVAGVPYALPEAGQPPKVLQLAPNQNHLELEFGGISFAGGEILRYQYMLDGGGDQWSALSTQRSVNYAGLSPGHYRFLVRAAGLDGATGPEPASLSFTIDPPMWRRWWFLTLLLLSAVMTGLAGHRYRLGRVLELERVRTRIATDIHDDIGSSLSQIALLSGVAQRRLGGSDTQVSEPLERIAGVSRELLDSMSDIVWAINPRHDNSADLVQRMRRFATDVFTAGGIDFRFEASGASREIRFGADTRRHLYLIFKECVNNVARHSQCRHVSVQLKLDDDWLLLDVCDDGKGFVIERAGEGHGLASMRARAKLLGGEIEIEGGEGQGSRISLRVPEGRRQFRR